MASNRWMLGGQRDFGQSNFGRKREGVVVQYPENVDLKVDLKEF